MDSNTISHVQKLGMNYKEIT